MVLPEPVRLPPMQSLPLRISGMQCFWMPVGLLIAMARREPTSHGLTSRAAKVVCGSVGARTFPWFVELAVVLVRVVGWPRAVREGTTSLGTRGSPSSMGETFLLFRAPCESRDSGSDAERSLSASDQLECDSETPGELGPEWPDSRLIVRDAAMRRDIRKGRGCDRGPDRSDAGKLFVGRNSDDGPRAKVFSSLAARIRGFL